MGQLFAGCFTLRERFHETLKGECIRVKTPLSVQQAQKLITEFVDHYNHQRLHSAIGYITPFDKLQGRAEDIHAQRERKLEAAREARKNVRKATRENNQLSQAAVCLRAFSESEREKNRLGIGQKWGAGGDF